MSIVAARSGLVLMGLAVCLGCHADGQCLRESLNKGSFPPELVSFIRDIDAGKISHGALCKAWANSTLGAEYAALQDAKGDERKNAPWTIMFAPGVMQCTSKDDCAVSPIAGIKFHLSDPEQRVNTANAALSPNKIGSLVNNKNIAYIAPNCTAFAAVSMMKAAPEPVLPATTASAPLVSDVERGCERDDSAPWGVSDACVPQFSASDHGRDGKPQRIVAILDNGVDCLHPAIHERIDPLLPRPTKPRRCNGYTGHNYFYEDKNPNVAPDNCDPKGKRCRSHGTGVAGVIASQAHEVPGVDPKARLVSMRILGPTHTLPFVQPWTKVATAILDSADRAQILNISAAWYVNYPWLAAAVERATADEDHLIVAAASPGNSGPPYPAAFTKCNDAVIGVTSILRSSDAGHPYAWASSADRDEAYMVAAGADVLTAYSHDEHRGDALYALQQGSSFAAPHAAGAASLVWNSPEFERCKAAGVREILECSARITLIAGDPRKRLHLGCLFTQRDSPICRAARRCIESAKAQYCRR